MSESSQNATRTAAFGGARELHALIDTVPDAMIVIDTEARIVSFSRGAEQMFGYAEEDILGENISLLMPSPDRERHDDYIRRYLDTGERRIIGIGRVTTARHRDGSTFPIDLAVGELRLGEARLFSGFIRDLTESRATEKQLHALQAELAHVSRITSMGTLATSIAHELNQPLTAVANYTQAARDLLVDPDAEAIETVREALDECAKETLRAGQIVRRLRDFISRGETTRRLSSLEKLVKEATALALINGDVRGLDVQSRLDPDNDEVLVDPIQIQQVLVNLLRNALEAMEASPVKILSIESRPGPQGMLTVSVSDSGPGIEPHVADKLFHPFVSSKESGMGLGLSICHTIISSHGGRIWVEPSEFGGTRFNFTLMTADSEVEDE